MTTEDMIVVWDSMKPFINKKEILAAADAYIATLDDMGLVEEHLREEFSYDTHLKAALITFLGEEEENEY